MRGPSYAEAKTPADVEQTPDGESIDGDAIDGRAFRGEEPDGNHQLDADRLDDARALAAEASHAADVAELPEGPIVGLILRSALAQRTGEGPEEVEAEVRRELDGMSFAAQGWRAGLLAQMGRDAEAVSIWRPLAPHVEDLPVTMIEWLVSQAAHATLAVLAGDRDSARTSVHLLEPCASHQVSPTSITPSGGPVALVLGRLCAFLDDDGAEAWLREVVTRADAVLAPWYEPSATWCCGLHRRIRPSGPRARGTTPRSLDSRRRSRVRSRPGSASSPPRSERTTARRFRLGQRRSVRPSPPAPAR